MRDLHLDIIFLDLFGVFDATRLSSFVFNLDSLYNLLDTNGKYNWATIPS